MARKQIPDGPASHAEERGPRKPIKEARHKHGLDVLGHRAWNEPYHEQGKRGDIDISPAIKLGELLAHIPSKVSKQTSDNGARKSGPMPTTSQRTNS